MMLATCLTSLAAFEPAQSASRRAVLQSTISGFALPLIANAGGVPEGMKTSESYSSLQQIAPEITGTLGAGTMSSRSRPVTGVILLEEVQQAGPAISAELVLDGGVAATATFQAESQFALIRGMFYDVEVRSKTSDGAFLQVTALPEGKSMAEIDDRFLLKSVFSTEGRWTSRCSLRRRGPSVFSMSPFLH